MNRGQHAIALRVLCVVTSFLAVAALPSAAEAATSSSGPASNYKFSVEPYAASGTQQRSEFNYELQPGHSILDQVVILNNSTNPESFTAYPEDATNIKGTGGFAFQQQGDIQNSAVGKWITMGETSFTLPPGKEAIDTFELALPADASPGDHVGAIVVQQNRSPAQATSKEGLNLVLRFAVPVYVRVVGPVRPGMTIENVTVFHDSPLIPYVNGAARTAVRFTLVNSGNITLFPNTAKVSITALIGGTIHSYTVHRNAGAQTRQNPLPAQILPGGQLVLTEIWNGTPPFDPLTAHVSVSASDPGSTLPVVTASSTTFWYFPWLPVLILIALIVGLLLWRRWRHNRTQRKETPPGAQSAGGSAVDSGAPSESVEISVEEIGV
jgi:hypothetical protein